jgi:hypothetical protein
MKRAAVGCVAGLLALSLSGQAFAQESKSAPLAKQLAAALDGAKLEAIAAKDSSTPDLFYGALYFPGVQLLVVSAKYAAPQLLAEKLAKKEYRDVYIDLNSASMPGTKIFIEDLAADGLKAQRDSNQPFDTCETGSKRTSFNSDWKAQKMSEQEYMKAFSTADDRYAEILAALLAQLKKTS